MVAGQGREAIGCGAIAPQVPIPRAARSLEEEGQFHRMRPSGQRNNVPILPR
ncbi:MAG: hypothetical protein ACODTL_08400 [Brucella sp.]|uniref:hypothetical protein n=1 Tax=Ochrobactrum sp. A-1 TaxID=2920940 RepID=UPI001F0B2249|nr:hypothetical protein [Ochrobactrum sp. A-1]